MSGYSDYMFFSNFGSYRLTKTGKALVILLERQQTTHSPTQSIDVKTGAVSLSGNLTLSTNILNAQPFVFAIWFKKFILLIT